MSLRTTLTELMVEADARGRAGPKRLAGGAHLEVRSRIEAQGSVDRRLRQLRISRSGVAPSATEITTFRRDGRIPPEAIEAAFHSAATNTYTITITWEVRLLALPEAALPDTL